MTTLPLTYYTGVRQWDVVPSTEGWSRIAGDWSKEDAERQANAPAGNPRDL